MTIHSMNRLYLGSCTSRASAGWTVQHVLCNSASPQSGRPASDAAAQVRDWACIGIFAFAICDIRVCGSFVASRSAPLRRASLGSTASGRRICRVQSWPPGMHARHRQRAVARRRPRLRSGADRECRNRVSGDAISEQGGLPHPGAAATRKNACQLHTRSTSPSGAGAAASSRREAQARSRSRQTRCRSHGEDLRAARCDRGSGTDGRHDIEDEATRELTRWGPCCVTPSPFVGSTLAERAAEISMGRASCRYAERARTGSDRATARRAPLASSIAHDRGGTHSSEQCSLRSACRPTHGHIRGHHEP